jgi:hypothetical protein
MNRPATATVEVLTAEVRVLMVGSRQVTLSVARQLDWVERSELEPFGRVRLVAGEVLIGRDPGGVLTLAELWPETPSVPIIHRDELAQPILVCLTTLSENRDEMTGGVTLPFEGEMVGFDHPTFDLFPDCFQHEREGLPRCEQRWDFRGQERSIRALMVAHQHLTARRAADESLPLIVLAGLR